MARPLRIEYEGALYHITTRGNAGNSVFLADADRHAFLDLLAEAVRRFSWICHAYCLMGNHYHLLVETPVANLSSGMRHLNGVFTQRSNRRHGRAGHLFQGRYRSILVERDSHLLELARYIVLNPVRAGLSRAPDSWRWSSYRATAGLAASPEFLCVDWILSQFGSDARAAAGAYREFVRQGRGCHVWDELRSGHIMGTDAFVERLAPLLRAVKDETEIPRLERLAARPRLETLFQGVKDKPTRDARIHEAMRTHGYTLREIGEHLGLYYSTISVIAQRVEKRLETPRMKT